MQLEEIKDGEPKVIIRRQDGYLCYNNEPAFCIPLDLWKVNTRYKWGNYTIEQGMLTRGQFTMKGFVFFDDMKFSGSFVFNCKAGISSTVVARAILFLPLLDDR